MATGRNNGVTWALALQVSLSTVMESFEMQFGCNHFPYTEPRCFRKDGMDNETIGYTIETDVEEEGQPNEPLNDLYAYVCFDKWDSDRRGIDLPSKEDLRKMQRTVEDKLDICWEPSDFKIWLLPDHCTVD